MADITYNTPTSHRRYNGHLLECPDPGPAARHFVFLHNTTALHKAKLVNLHVLPPSEQRIGWCVAGLYSKLLYFPMWVSDAVAAGVDDLWVYHSRLTADSAAAMASYQNSSHAGQDVSSMAPFKPAAFGRVTYVETQAPPGQWDTASKPTYYTTCIQMARHSHAYVIISDPDEYLHLVPQPTPATLRHLLDSVCPHNAGGLELQAFLYPEPCQGVDIGADGASSRDMHAFLAHQTQPKTIVLPSRCKTFDIHWARQAEADAAGEPYVSHSISPDLLFFKHVRAWDGDGCTFSLQSHLVDDSDLEQLRHIFLSDDWRIK